MKMIGVRTSKIVKSGGNLFASVKLFPRGFAAQKETYSENQEKKGRPISPHVTIYDFPIAGISSITNRITGMALWTGERFRYVNSSDSKVLMYR